MFDTRRENGNLNPTLRSEMRQGWPYLSASLLGNMVGLHVLPPFTIGFFIPPLQQTFGWSRAELSLGVTVLTLCTAVGVMTTGGLLRRGHIRLLMASGMLVLALGYWALSQLQASLWEFWGILALMALFGGGCSPATLTRMVVSAFSRHRGLALGASLIGPGLASAVVPVFLVPIIQVHGWRSGYETLCGIMLAAMPVMLLFQSLGKRQMSPATPSYVACRPSRSGLTTALTCAFFLVSLAIGGVVVHLPAMAIDNGYTPAGEAGLTSLMGISLIFSRLLTGFLVDRLFAPAIAAAIMALGALGFVTVWLADTHGILLAAVFTGLCLGAELDLIAYLASRYFDTASYGRTFGLLYGAFQVGVSLSPLIYGGLHDHMHAYGPAFAGSAVCLVAAALVFWQLPPFPHSAPEA